MTERSDLPHPRPHAALASDAIDHLTVAEREVAADGLWWHVLEIETAERLWAHGDRCLLFISPEVIRRVWEYPADWWQLPDDALYAVSWRR